MPILGGAAHFVIHAFMGFFQKPWSDVVGSPKKNQVAESPMTRTQGSIEALPETMVFTCLYHQTYAGKLRVFLPTLGKDGFWCLDLG
jgi:hypothetical protein